MARIEELAEQYEQSATAIRKRISELKRQLKKGNMTDWSYTTAQRLERRILILESMYRDTKATAAYLRNYYKEK